MGKIPKFYGAVTVGERGQIVITAEARRELTIPAGTKLLAFGNTDEHALMFIKVEYMTEFITAFSTLVSKFEQTMKNAETHE